MASLKSTIVDGTLVVTDKIRIKALEAYSSATTTTSYTLGGSGYVLRSTGSGAYWQYVSDSSSAGAISSSNTYLVTERDVYHGLPTINGGHSYNSNTNYYVAAATGTSGQILTWPASGNTPVWANPQPTFPTGGTTGQALVKNSNTDNDVKWATIDISTAVKVYNRDNIGTSPNYDNPGVNGFFELRASSEVTGQSGIRPPSFGDTGYGGFLNLKTSNNTAMLQIAGANGGGFYIRGKQAASVTMASTAWQHLITADLSSTNLSNCNSVTHCGIFTHTGFTNRPATCTNWGTLINYRLYEANNNFHRQIFLDCYDSDKIWTRSCSSGTWTNWKMLLNEDSGVPRYHYGTTAGASTYILITINKYSGWMLNFTLKLYSSYVATDLQISGYNYAGNYWHAPQAVILGRTEASNLNVYFGYTEAYHLWVAVPSGNYDGADIVGYTNGYIQVDADNLFTITRVASLPGTLQSTVEAKKPWVRGESVTGAVWNDYAEYRNSICNEPGYCVQEFGDDSLVKTQNRLDHFAGVTSDTWGFAQGETKEAKTPIAVAGRVLVYTFQDRDKYKPGDCVCAAPNGTVDIMTRDEIIQYPDRIVGTVSCVPDYDTWGGGEDRQPIQVNGRIWIKVR